MKNLTLNNIALATGGILKNADSASADTEVTSVTLDSRQVTEGGIFIATKGSKVDGHSFIGQVAEKKVLGAVVEKDIENCPVPYVLVEDSFKALKDIARFYRASLSIPVIGVTGSVGKTSTKEFIAGTLGVKYKVCKTQGNYNNEVGLPLTILSIREDDEIAVLEMGISDFGEMSRLAEIARPDTCVITNIGQCHLEFLHNRDGVLQAKTEIFKFMNPDGAVFLNGDDDKLSMVKQPHKRQIVHFGMSPTNEIYATDIVNKGFLGSECSIVMFGFRFDVKVPLPGKHMIYNAMVAAGVGKEYKLTNEQIAEGIASVVPTGGRSNVIKTDKYTLIDDCYNANPVSMKAAVDLLSVAGSRKVAILGDMLELGENEKKLHREVGEYALNHGVDVLVTIGDRAICMYEGALNSPCGTESEIYCFGTLEEAMEGLPSILKEDDTVLIKASHGMHLEKIVEFLKNE